MLKKDVIVGKVYAMGWAAHGTPSARLESTRPVLVKSVGARGVMEFEELDPETLEPSPTPPMGFPRNLTVRYLYCEWDKARERLASRAAAVAETLATHVALTDEMLLMLPEEQRESWRERVGLIQYSDGSFNVDVHRMGRRVVRDLIADAYRTGFEAGRRFETEPSE